MLPILLGLAIVALPLLPLAGIHHFFCRDWLNNLWSIGYIANSFRHHLIIPAISNAAETIFYPNQVFYCYLLYPIAGVLGSVLGAEIATRLIVAAVLGLQFFLVYRAVMALVGSKLWGVTAALLVTWAIYPLTNLFNRGALSEFVATTLVSCALCSWFIMLQASCRRGVVWPALVTALSLALALGTHPITALYCGPILGIIFLASLPLVSKLERSLRRDVLVALPLMVLLILVVDAPFIYAALKYSSRLLMVPPEAVTVWPEHIDNFFFRFSPLPLDKRSLIWGTHHDTPYLDTQANTALLLLLFGVFYFGKFWRRGGERRALPVTLASVVVFLFASWLSFSSTPYRYLPQVATLIQFGYRMISFMNVALLAVLFSLMLLGKSFFTAPRRGELQTVFLTVCITLSFAGVMGKMLHVGAVRANKAALGIDEHPAYLEIPEGFPKQNYTLRDVSELTAVEASNLVRVRFPLGAGAHYGEPGDTEVNLVRAGWVGTNLAAFEWSQLNVDGARVPASQLKKFDSGYAAFLPVGRHHLHAALNIDPTWAWLRTLSLMTLAIAFLACGALKLLAELRKGQ